LELDAGIDFPFSSYRRNRRKDEQEEFNGAEAAQPHGRNHEKVCIDDFFGKTTEPNRATSKRIKLHG